MNTETTKERKELALQLIAQIEQGGDANTLAEAIRQVDILTATERLGIVEWRNYATSVDACLTLPLREHETWQLNQRVNRSAASPGIIWTAVIWHGHVSIEGKSLPLAMLKAWWLLRVED